MLDPLKKRIRTLIENNGFDKNRLYACVCILAFTFCILGITLTAVRMGNERQLRETARYESVVREMVPELQARLAADSTLAIDAGAEIKSAVLSHKVDNLSISLVVVSFILAMILATGIFTAIQLKRKKIKLWNSHSTSQSTE